MLCNFPTELIENILLYVSTVDLFATVRINRRLYGIAHAQKTPLRHRLKKITLDISLEFENYGDRSHGESVERFRLIVQSKIVGITYSHRYIRVAFSSNPIGQLWHRSQILAGDDSVRKASKLFLNKVTSGAMHDFDSISSEEDEYDELTIVGRSKDEAVDNFQSFLLHLTSDYVIKRFRVRVDHSIEAFKQFVPFFDAHPLLTRCRPSVSVNNALLDVDGFFECGLFERGVLEAEFYRVNEYSRYEDYKSLVHKALRTAKSIRISGSRASLNDEDLHKLAEMTRADLSLRGVRRVSPIGYTQFIRYFYENPQRAGRSVEIEGKCYLLSEVMYIIPTCDYVILNEDRQEIEVKSKYGQLFKLTVLSDGYKPNRFMLQVSS